MSSDPRLGTTLAQYRLDAVIGHGGMGVVYLAFDTRLERRVAVKVMAPEVAQDPSFRKRFEREARMAAAIDHPNIIPIHDTGEDNGVLWLAMRYVDGTDLRALIVDAGALPPARGVPILRQVASALDAAHARGLVHRDVKPANILIASGSAASSDEPDHVYLTDFGLTKEFRRAERSMTATGQFVGSIDYVAPEQVEGRAIDGRADQYSLACVMYECLTGVVPFAETSDIATLFAHIHQEPPPPSEVRPELPKGVDAVVARAMAKAPDDRFATCVEFVAAARDALGLGAPAAEPSGGPVAPPPPGGAGGTVVAGPPPVPAPDVWTSPPPPPLPPDGGGTEPRRPNRGVMVGAIVAALVVAGGLVFAVSRGGQPGATGTTGAGKTTGATSSATTGATSSATTGATSSATTGATTGATSHATTGTAPPAFTCADVSTTNLAPPDAAVAQIFAMDRDGSNQARISIGSVDQTGPSFSPDCSQVVFSQTKNGNKDVYVMNSDGTDAKAITHDPAEDGGAEWSPTAQRLVWVSKQHGNPDVYTMNPDGTDKVRLTTDPGFDGFPAWSADGTKITWSSQEAGDLHIFVMNADGSGKRQVTRDPSAGDKDPALTPDGKEIAFTSTAADGSRQIFVIGIDGSGRRQLTGAGAAAGGGGDNEQPEYSPDGRRIVFTSDRDGNREIYAMDADGSNQHRLTDF
ncbi:MAG TPA: protein kinase, partial [Actinomycetota bacterium]|nr:protein kinase [Actinomycetota bacterium]